MVIAITQAGACFLIKFTSQLRHEDDDNDDGATLLRTASMQLR
jgi:hypothetical protein